MISNSKWHEEHPFAGPNTQQLLLKRNKCLNLKNPRKNNFSPLTITYVQKRNFNFYCFNYQNKFTSAIILCKYECNIFQDRSENKMRFLKFWSLSLNRESDINFGSSSK